MRIYYILMLALLVNACANTDQKVHTQEAADTPLAPSKNSDKFNDQFRVLLQNYYDLKDALVASNDTLGAKSAQHLSISADSLDLAGVQADSSIVDLAKGNIGTISSEARALALEKNMDEMRKSFQIISESMYDLIRTVNYDRQKVYHIYCSMYNNNQGGYWLNASDEIKNPYFGKRMLTCGEVKDTIDFGRK